MSSDDERAQDWIEHIVENCDRVASYLEGMSFADFAADMKARDAVERCIERVTEASVRLGPERLARIAPDVPLNEVRGLGNILRHEYDRVNAKLIWDTAKDDLPALRAACMVALRRTSD